MRAFIQKILPIDDLVATIRRFPLSVLCAVALFFIAVFEIHDLIDFDSDNIARVVATLSCLYFWFGISKLVSESQKKGIIVNLALSVVGAMGIAGIIFLSPLWWQNLLFLTPSILLILMVAPYFKGGDDLSFWFFNRTVWFGVAVSYIALLMFAGGVCTALWAIQELFGVSFPDEVWGDIWAFSCLVLGPVYALSWVPKTFDFTEEDCNDPPGLKFIVNWISAPMVLVYLLILYAYFAKILFTQDIPEGILAYLISGFIGAGVVTYLISWPLRESGSVQLRFFHRIFFPALLIPVGFHFFAIWERIGAYGITEQRYFILITAVWFMIISVGNLRGRMPIKAIPATLAILLLLTSFGPWGAVSVSGHSQFSRLQSLMHQNGLLVDGEIVKKDVDSVPRDDRISISSIIDYICQTDRDELIEPWFNTEKKDDWQCYSGYNVVDQLGFPYANRYSYREDNDMNIHIWSSNAHKNPRDISDYDYFVKNGNLQFLNEAGGCASSSCKLDDEDMVYVFRQKDTAIILFQRDGFTLHEYDLSEFLIENREHRNSDKPLFIEFETDDLKLRMDIHNANATTRDDQPVLNSLGYDLMYRFKGSVE